MAKLLEKIFPIPIGFHIFDMANQIDDEQPDLPQELAKVDEKTDFDYYEHFKTKTEAPKGNSGKGKSSKFKDENKVKEGQLNKEKVDSNKKEKTNEQKELGE